MEVSSSYILLFVGIFQYVSCGLPIVMWHGLGDVCCNPLSLGGLKKFIEHQIPDVHIVSVKVGSSIREVT